MPSEEVLNIREISEYLKIPVSTTYKLIQEGRIPAIKLGKHWRVMKKDIDRLFVERPQIKFKRRARERGADTDPAEQSDSNPEKGGDHP